MTLDSRTRWLALYVLCLGDLMIVLDGTIVNVALPTIRDDLGFSETSLAWVVNAYLLTFGGFLLLGGRLGDFFGQRRMFLIGIGAVHRRLARAAGLRTRRSCWSPRGRCRGSAARSSSAVALSLVMTLFTEGADRAKAMGIFGFVLSGGGVAGVLAGGVLTEILSWHWIFLVNIPVGALVFALSLRLLPAVAGQRERSPRHRRRRHRDRGADARRVRDRERERHRLADRGDARPARRCGRPGRRVPDIEARIAAPLMPLSLFRNRSVSSANVIGR